MADMGTLNVAARDYIAALSASPPYASLFYAGYAWTGYLAAIEANAGSLDPVGAVAGSLRAASNFIGRHEAESAKVIELAINPAFRRNDPVLRIGTVATMSRISDPRLIKKFVGTGMNPSDIPVGSGKWTGSNPTSAEWGGQSTFIIPDAISFVPAFPPAYGTAPFNTALLEVRTISDNRTPEQVRIARKWSDAAGSSTPLGHWNLIASEVAAWGAMTALAQAKVLCYLNLAMYDAGIACWKAKYLYWLLRPSQADPLIVPPEGMTVPNFPSYTSGHATFSGAASRFLELVFPANASDFTALAEEAAVSRLYAGFHYRFDNDAGLAIGRSIGNLAFSAYQADTLGSP